MRQKIAMACTIIIIAVCTYFLYADFRECQREYHRGCTPGVGPGPKP